MAKVDKANIQAVFIVPDNFTVDMRDSLGQLVVERIRANTRKGLDKDGVRFPGYTKEYIGSLDFKNAGKSKKVNLTSTGDMLAELDIVSHKPGELVVGYPTGHVDSGKAEGNVIGSYGASSGNAGRARPFIGLPAKQYKLLVEKINAQLPEEAKAEKVKTSLIDKILNIGRLKNET